MAPWCSISEMDPSDPEMCAGSVECLAKSYDRQQFPDLTGTIIARDVMMRWFAEVALLGVVREEIESA